VTLFTSARLEFAEKEERKTRGDGSYLKSLDKFVGLQLSDQSLLEVQAGCATHFSFKHRHTRKQALRENHNTGPTNAKGRADDRREKKRSEGRKEGRKIDFAPFLLFLFFTSFIFLSHFSLPDPGHIFIQDQRPSTVFVIVGKVRFDCLAELQQVHPLVLVDHFHWVLFLRNEHTSMKKKRRAENKPIK